MIVIPSQIYFQDGRFLVCRSRQFFAFLLLLASVFSLPVSHAETVLDDWRSQIADTRLLAENDVPDAYAKTLKLMAEKPPGITPQDQAAILNLRARVELYLAMTADADQHARMAYAIASQHDDWLGQAEADLVITVNAIYQGNLDLLAQVTTRSLATLEGKNRPDLVAESMLRNAMMYRRLRRFDESIALSVQILAYAKSTGNVWALAHGHHGMGITYEHSGRYAEALTHFASMLDIARKVGSRFLEADAMLGIGNNSAQLGNWKAGEEMVQQAILLMRKAGSPFIIAKGLYLQADLLHKRGRYQEAIPLLDESVEIHQSHKSRIALWWTLIARSQIFQKLGRMREAGQDAEQAARLARDISSPVYLSDSAKRLAELAQAEGAFEKAYLYMAEASREAEQAERKLASVRVLELTGQYEEESRKRQLEELNLENERQAADLQRNMLKTRFLMTLLISAAILLLTTVFFITRLRRTNRLLGHEIAERVRIDAALEDSERQHRTLVENTPDTIARYDRDGRRIFANRKMMLDAEQVASRLPEEARSSYEARIRNVIETGQPEEFEITSEDNERPRIVSFVRLTPEFDQDGSVASVLAVGRDITEIDEYRQSIHRMAFYDKLTELPNRTLLIEHIQQAIADASWHHHQFGLMMLDLDRFKEINDTLGHSVGDQVLRKAAERLHGCVRVYDTVARLGGDEFGILLPQVRDSSDLAMIASKIIESFAQPFNIDGREMFVSTSIGIAVYPSDSTDIDALFRFSDSAMYHAKRQGRDNFQFYSSDLTTKAAGRMSIENALRKALDKQELELYYQPQMDVATGTIIGVEALLRWNRDGKEMVSPEHFISIAEESGLIVGIGEWVLETACRAATEWNRDFFVPLQLGVNLSTRQFIMNDLVSTLRTVLQLTACQPAWIKLEITESLLLEDSKEIATALQALDEMGLKISIDDFGTGYSALSYLNRFPVSQIKIDRSFVRDIPQDRDKSELVKAMISIANALRMDLVAEGVETQEQADYLLANGCRKVQGYLYGKPMPKAVFEKMLAQQVVYQSSSIASAESSLTLPSA